MILSFNAGPSEQESKPRASGDDPSSEAFSVVVPVVNPARAGMILWSWVTWAWNGKPRASGDDPGNVVRALTFTL